MSIDADKFADDLVTLSQIKGAASNVEALSILRAYRERQYVEEQSK